MSGTAVGETDWNAVKEVAGAHATSVASQVTVGVATEVAEEAGAAAGLAAVAPQVAAASEAAATASAKATEVAVSVNNGQVTIQAAVTLAGASVAAAAVQGQSTVNAAADGAVAALGGVVSNVNAAAGVASGAASSAQNALGAIQSFADGQVVPCALFADRTSKVPAPVVDVSKIDVYADPPAPAAANADGSNRNGIWIYRAGGWQRLGKNTRALDADIQAVQRTAAAAGLDGAAVFSATSIDDASTGMRHSVRAGGMALAEIETLDLDPLDRIRELDTLLRQVRHFYPQLMVESRVGNATTGNIVERTGPTFDVLPANEPLAEMVSTGLDNGERIRSTDTQLRLVTHGFAQQVPDLRLGSVDAEDLIESTGKATWALGGLLAFADARGMLVELDPATGTMTIRLDETRPAKDGALMRTPAGEVYAKVADPGYVTNRWPNLGLAMPPPTTPMMPRFIPAAMAPDRALANRQWQGVPSMEAVTSTRLFAAWMTSTISHDEAPGDFVVLSYTDDAWATTKDLGYIVMDDPAYRVGNQVFWLAPDGALHCILCIVRDLNDIYYGTFGITIQNPKAALPIAGTLARLATFGIPARPKLIDGRVLMPLDVRPTTAGPLYPLGLAGTTIVEYDPQHRQVICLGRSELNLGSSPSWPESSLEQLNGGELIYVWRTGVGQMISRSPSGNPNGPWTAFAPWTALKATPDGQGRYNAESRANVRTTPNGRLVVAWNDNTDRANLTIGISVDGGQTLQQKVAFGVTGRVAYPEITFDPGNGDILVIFDRDRPTRGQILMARISEAALLAGTAVPVITTISILPGATP